MAKQDKSWLYLLAAQVLGIVQLALIIRLVYRLASGQAD